MARCDIYVAATPARVFEVLEDPGSYGDWVVGSRKILAADQAWPAPGAEFQHTVGLAPLLISDRTTVLSASSPRHLELRARARPLPAARISLRLEPEGNGTRVTMIEDLDNRVLNLLAGPLAHAIIRVRNRESLRRLKAMAEGISPPPSSRPALRGSA